MCVIPTQVYVTPTQVCVIPSQALRRAHADLALVAWARRAGLATEAAAAVERVNDPFWIMRSLMEIPVEFEGA